MLGAVSPDVILLDLRMPRMDGLDFIRRLDRKGIRIPIVVCSGAVSDGEPLSVPGGVQGGPEGVRPPRAPGGPARGRAPGRREVAAGHVAGTPGRHRLARLRRRRRLEPPASAACLVLRHRSIHLPIQ